MSQAEFDGLERGDQVAVKQYPGKEGLVVKNHPNLQVYVEGVGVVMDARPADLTMTEKGGGL